MTTKSAPAPDRGMVVLGADPVTPVEVADADKAFGWRRDPDAQDDEGRDVARELVRLLLDAYDGDPVLASAAGEGPANRARRLADGVDR